MDRIGGAVQGLLLLPAAYVPWFSISRGRANTLQARPALECAWHLFFERKKFG